uniref:Low density lipoprotein receptor class A domain containing 1 n=1 Tax=Gopherus evgoodei TaxID=1825980 RepID=A0A8C4WKM0_9SAUR
MTLWASHLNAQYLSFPILKWGISTFPSIYQGGHVVLYFSRALRSLLGRRTETCEVILIANNRFLSHYIYVQLLLSEVRTFHYLQVSHLVDDLPSNLPGYLIFRCSNAVYWIYADQKCNGANDCGDCSDEKGTCNCPPCGIQWWRCTPVFFEYCTCIPRAFCQDKIQHCSDWSDEYACNR